MDVAEKTERSRRFLGPLAPFAVWLEAAADLLWPMHCAGCGRSAKTDCLCRSCAVDLPLIKAPLCEVCSQPFPGGGSSLVCSNCRERHFHFVCSLSHVRAHGYVREMIHRLKYNGERWLALPLANWMAELRDDARLEFARIEALVPVPLHPLRQRERGFNQAALLADNLSRHWNIPSKNFLRRTVYTETQTHFARHVRLQNLRDAFQVPDPALIEGKSLLLVDDVFTTGATLDECARTLLDNGSGPVWGITAARA